MRIFTHPDNIPILKRTLSQETISGAHFVAISGFTVDVTGSRLIDRFRWQPPAASKFCEYGPEDETWMRPLRLGTLEPVYYVMK